MRNSWMVSSALLWSQEASAIRASNSSFHSNLSTSWRTRSSQSPRKATSLTFLSESRSKPPPIPSNDMILSFCPVLKIRNFFFSVKTIFCLFTFSRLINKRGTCDLTRSTRDAKGWTTNEEPMIIKSEALGKSTLTHWKNRSGSDSPKKTMSGLTSPSQSSHLGTPSKILSRKKNWNVCND